MNPAGSSPTTPQGTIRAAAIADAGSATRDTLPVAPAPSNCRTKREFVWFFVGGSGHCDEKTAVGTTVVSVAGCRFRVDVGRCVSRMSSRTTTHARHDTPSRCAFPLTAPSQPRSSRRPAALVPSLDVHLGEVGDGVVERVRAGDVDGLLRLHRRRITAWCALSAST